MPLTTERSPEDWRRWRRGVGASLNELAAAAGVHRNSVWMIEQGRRKPSAEMQFKLAHGLRQLAERSP